MKCCGTPLESLEGREKNVDVAVRVSKEPVIMVLYSHVNLRLSTLKMFS